MSKNDIARILHPVVKLELAQTLIHVGKIDNYVFEDGYQLSDCQAEDIKDIINKLQNVLNTRINEDG